MPSKSQNRRRSSLADIKDGGWHAQVESLRGNNCRAIETSCSAAVMHAKSCRATVNKELRRSCRTKSCKAAFEEFELRRSYCYTQWKTKWLRNQAFAKPQNRVAAAAELQHPPQKTWFSTNTKDVKHLKNMLKIMTKKSYYTYFLHAFGCQMVQKV